MSYGIKMVLLRFNKQEKEWVVIPKSEKVEGDIYLDGKLRKCLDYYKSRQRKNNDCGIIITGDEGSGKSTVAGNIMEYMSDGKFNPTKEIIGSDYLDGLEKIEKVKTGGRLLFDEGNVFFLATETVKKEHRDLHKIFSIFRQKNLFFIICLPSFFRLGSYFALDRSSALITTYLKRGKRGSFSFHGKKGKDKLYRIGKKTYNPKIVKPKFRGKFTKCYKLENKEYRKIKEQTLHNEIGKARDRQKKPPTMWESQQRTRLDIIKKNHKLPAKELAKLLGLSEQRIFQIRREIKAEL